MTAGSCGSTASYDPAFLQTKTPGWNDSEISAVHTQGIWDVFASGIDYPAGHNLDPCAYANMDYTLLSNYPCEDHLSSFAYTDSRGLTPREIVEIPHSHSETLYGLGGEDEIHTRSYTGSPDMAYPPQNNPMLPAIPLHNSTLLSLRPTCHFGTPCGMLIDNVSLVGIQQHLEQFHRHDVRPRPADGLVACNWTSCGELRLGATLGEHIVAKHVLDPDTEWLPDYTPDHTLHTETAACELSCPSVHG
ncbi:hypothetical protein DAEQUDRAFT_733142 [Daedalea quercina L-15889]|uniref:Uncharacterized protein n=1 Tax=Daedalea quercina L-15889 TaxID=1314783 RepID=A0A165L7F8_9APHY|nr:hypothetical protein DAEQUDRAFT_733142 [Daedalea quercina L-15889]